MKFRSEYLIHNNSLKRVFQILDLYTINDHEFGVNDVARKLSVNISTASRMLADLQEIGVLERSNNNNKYLFGEYITKLAHVYYSTLDLETISKPYLVELSEKTNFGVRIHVIEGDKRRCIAWVDSNQPVRHVMSPDAVYGPLHAGAPGILLLASLPDENISEILKRTGFTKYTNNTIDNMENLKKEIHKIL
jgi:DNA-binding IclR family transcriptional regulator